MVKDKMNELLTGLVGGAIIAMVAIYIAMGGRRSSSIRDPFGDDRSNPEPKVPSVDVEKEIEVIKNESEKDRPKIDLSPVDIAAVNSRLDQLRAKYKKPE